MKLSDVADPMRELAKPMPRARLVPVTAVIQAISHLSEDQASIPELVDALWQSYDCDTMMMYDGRGNGLAEALDGNPLARYGGYNERKGIVTELFNSCYWRDPENNFSSFHHGISTSEILMSTVDGLRLAAILWEFFIPGQTFDHITFLNLISNLRVTVPKIDGVQPSQLNEVQERNIGIKATDTLEKSGDISKNVGNARIKQPSARVGASLHPVTDLWPVISEALGVSLEQASEFVISKFEDLELELWIDSKYDGLWRTTQNSNSSDMMALRDAVNSAKKDGWTPDTYQLWSYQRLAPFGFNAIKNAAMEIKNFDDGEQRSLISQPVMPAVEKKKTELIEIPLIEYLHLKHSLVEIEHRVRSYAEMLALSNVELEAAKTYANDLTVKSKKPDHSSTRAETTYSNIIGGLLGLMLGKSPSGAPRSVYMNQSMIVSALLAHYEHKHGIRLSTLEQKFAEANRSINA